MKGFDFVHYCSPSEDCTVTMGKTVLYLVVLVAVVASVVGKCDLLPGLL